MLGMPPEIPTNKAEVATAFGVLWSEKAPGNIPEAIV
jgi:hypothetical protein